MAEKSKKYDGNAQFAKLQRADDAKKAASEYESSAAALRAKPKGRSKKKGSSSSLSDFLDGQAKEGRNG
jgi:hypothetical protein